MATKDPNSRLTEGNTNSPYSSSPYASPNGATEQPAVPGTTSAGAAGSESDVRAQHEESAGEKIGRFFRRAMERLSGREDESWRRGNERNRRDREAEERSRSGDSSWKYGRPALPHRSQNEWRDLGRSRDDRNQSYRAGHAGDSGGGYERLSSEPQVARSLSYAQGITGRSYGPGEGEGEGERRGQGSGGYRPDENRSGSASPKSAGQTYGQQALGRSPGESYGLPEVPEQPVGRDRGFDEGHRREDWNRGQERWSERSVQGGARGMGPSYAVTGASVEFGADEDRRGDWGETARDRDQGQGRRFWQREPLSARDVMTRAPKSVVRSNPIREAAIIMRDENCGVVPVVDPAGRLQGILTDRDIVVRGLVNEAGLRVEDVMTDDVSAVKEDEPLTSVLDLMGRKQVRRVPVVDRNDRLLGIISMADIANRADYDEDLQDAFERISSRRSFWSLFS
jgi:CBS domain-containing protein